MSGCYGLNDSIETPESTEITKLLAEFNPDADERYVLTTHDVRLPSPTRRFMRRSITSVSTTLRTVAWKSHTGVSVPTSDPMRITLYSELRPVAWVTADHKLVVRDFNPGDWDEHFRFITPDRVALYDRESILLGLRGDFGAINRAHYANCCKMANIVADDAINAKYDRENPKFRSEFFAINGHEAPDLVALKDHLVHKMLKDF